MSRYIKWGEAGDQFTGRGVSGLPRMSKEFSISPAYFDFTGCDDSEARVKLDRWIKHRMPRQARDNDKVFALFKMCIAQIEYHRDWLNEHLHPRSQVRQTIFYIDKNPYAENVTVRYPWNATADTPQITGLPPDIMLLAKLEAAEERHAKEKEELKNKIDELGGSIKSTFENVLTDELDKRSIGGEGYAQSRDIMEKLSNLENLISQQQHHQQISTNQQQPPAEEV